MEGSKANEHDAEYCTLRWDPVRSLKEQGQIPFGWLSTILLKGSFIWDVGQSEAMNITSTDPCQVHLIGQTSHARCELVAMLARQFLPLCASGIYYYG